MVEEGNILHHVKREGELSGRGKCPDTPLRLRRFPPRENLAGGKFPAECSHVLKATISKRHKLSLLTPFDP